MNRRDNPERAAPAEAETPLTPADPGHPPEGAQPQPRGWLQAIARGAARPGMTLVEIMIVLTIMAGIMAFAAYSVVGYLSSAQIRNAEAEVNQIRGFIDTFRVIHNRLPDSLDQLTQRVDGMGNITDSVPNDPWGNPYEYAKRNDGTFLLFSLGPDGQSGTDDDIYPEGMQDRRY